MRIILKKIKKIKLSPLALIVTLIFVISIFGYQVSKIYAQQFSAMTRTLMTVKNDATMVGPVTVNNKVGIGVANPSKALEVAGNANFWGIAYGVSPNTNPNAVVTVAYANQKIDQYLGDPLPDPDPLCYTGTATVSCYDPIGQLNPDGICDYGYEPMEFYRTGSGAGCLLNVNCCETKW